jgi:hypothetical protein
MFDERLIEKRHVEIAIQKYLTGKYQHSPARSAFLVVDGRKLPAKFILRLAFFEATGEMVNSESFTGGRASVRVLKNLGFDVVYDKPTGKSGRRNPIKSARREAFRQIVAKHWGRVETEKKFPTICVPEFNSLKTQDPSLGNILDAIQTRRGIEVKGRFNHKLAFDFYVPKVNLVIEFDERQHFTPLRAVSLLAYPDDVELGFDRARWINLSEQIKAGDNSPIYRDEQRAFYDSIRDLCAPRFGLKPVVRIFEEDVIWEKETSDYSQAALKILSTIEKIINTK